MKRDDAMMLIERLAKDFKRAGTTTAPYHGYNSLTAYIVKSTRSTYENAHDWEVPGLFISYNEVERSPKPHLTILYVMGCGRIVYLILPKIIKMGEIKVPNNFAVIKKHGILNGEHGFWIALEHWVEIGNVSDYVVKKGQKKRAHLAKKVVGVDKPKKL